VLVGCAIVVATAGCGAAARGPIGRAAEPVSAAVVASIRLPDYGDDVAVRSDGARAYVALRSGKVVAIDTASRQVAATIMTDGTPAALALTPSGTRGYAMDLTAQSLFALDTKKDQVLKRIPVGIRSRPILTPAVAVAGDGRRAYVTNATASDDHLLVVDTATNAIVKDQFLPIHPVGVAVSPDGAQVYVAGCKLSCINGTLLVIDAATTTIASQIALAAAPSGMALAPDGSRVYLANGRDATVAIVYLRTQTVENVPVGTQPLGIAVGPRGRFVYVASFGDSRLDVLDTQTGRISATVSVASPPRAIAISPDGRFAYVTHTAPTCSVVDLTRIP
jgi:YVTN family beta-propeller protein